MFYTEQFPNIEIPKQTRYRVNSTNDNNNNKMMTIDHCLIAIVCWIQQTYKIPWVFPWIPGMCEADVSRKSRSPSSSKALQTLDTKQRPFLQFVHHGCQAC